MILQGTTLIGCVQLRVGPKLVSIAVHSAPFESDSATTAPGGLFVDASGEFGILVDQASPPAEVEQQVRLATEQVAKVVTRTLLN